MTAVRWSCLGVRIVRWCPECPVVSRMSGVCPESVRWCPESVRWCPGCLVVSGVSDLRLDMPTHCAVQKVSGKCPVMSGTCPEPVRDMSGNMSGHVRNMSGSAVRSCPEKCPERPVMSGKCPEMCPECPITAQPPKFGILMRCGGLRASGAHSVKLEVAREMTGDHGR